MRNYLIFLSIALVSCFSCGGSSSTNSSYSPSSTNPERGLYINIDEVLGDTTKEQALLNFVQKNKITYLLFYGVRSVLNSSASQKEALTLLVQKAKADYGVIQIGASVGGTESAQKVIDYNSSIGNKIDVINYECEYWNSNTNEDCPTFNDYKTALTWIKNNAGTMLVEAYLTIDRSTAAEAAQIRPLLNRLLVAAYVEDPADAFNSIRSWLSNFAPTNDSFEIWPIFNVGATPTWYDDFMGNWIAEQPSIKEAMDTAEATIKSDLEASFLSENINFTGYQYYKYSLF